MTQHIIWFDQLGRNDVNRVGGKNASLGEMIVHLKQAGIKVPNGFATTVAAYQQFLQENKLEKELRSLIKDVNPQDLNQLKQVGAALRQKILNAPFSAEFEQAIRDNYNKMAAEFGPDLSVAVRSSATAEDLPDASFAGQQETFLNVKGVEQVLKQVKEVFASLYNDRAISYRVHQGFNHDQVAISAGIQYMVRSDQAASGVMFSIDTESGFEDVVFLTSSYGLGELVVQGMVNPDEFYVYKPNLKAQRPAILRRRLGSKQQRMIYNAQSLTKIETVPKKEQLQFSITHQEIETLAQQAVLIEQHYGCAMDIEWAKDGITGDLYIVQARPETVQAAKSKQSVERYQLTKTAECLVEGRSIGQKIGQGRARVVQTSEQISQVQEGEVLVTDMTDPDWEPVMQKAAAIVTNRGGRTCHAAIIARELGIPAVVGCGDATRRIKNGMDVTVSCAEGETGFVYPGLLKYKVDEIKVDSIPKLPCKIMMNIGNPDRAFSFRALPNSGVGLARLEFIINHMIGIHPKTLLNFAYLTSEFKTEILEKVGCYSDPITYYVERLVEGISTLAAAFHPQPVIVRLSDFKSNEYANLVGGSVYEREEENPMLGFRGASRYLDPSFRECFELECRAIRKVREEMGFTNVQIMIPFVRTLDEARQVTELLAELGLKRGENDLKIIMMCELPNNALLAERYLAYFDGFSIGSNDLTQLTLGLDRDSALVAHRFDERDPAVKILLHLAIQACKKAGKYIGICGQGPSDYIDFAEWLVAEGIESISLNPDTVIATSLHLAKMHHT